MRLFLLFKFQVRGNLQMCLCLVDFPKEDASLLRWDSLHTNFCKGVWAVVVSGVDGVEVSSVKEFSFTATSSDKDDKLKIPKEILLEILGPSKVYHQVIKKVINIAIAKYVAKEGLKVGKDLQIFKWNSDNKLSGKRKDKSRKHDNSSIFFLQEEQHYGISPLLQNQNHLWWCCQGHAPWFLSKI
ncbi:PREDICTED: uncharacterized protein LOC105978181 isoform X6 [Erythranthe guttata]|uniref:uncharacterized protein LOC105978181 isoform X6 n=2 Tax=Erythranthe guttata TaxID=4155 RepID=UPI00064D7F77|nr:PREDICTED: uncharacterized protein LOC105978181 isoform X6 [Erythranthe guttata]|eukprot:XP_012859072.1 PREDICTED: uncharacterized protein LOC105978181 isoform X6 [Erythranthe guttata]